MLRKWSMEFQGEVVGVRLSEAAQSAEKEEREREIGVESAGQLLRLPTEFISFRTSLRAGS